jgi:hypothetical protein
MQVKVNELCMKIDELQHELNLKNGAVDRKLKHHSFFHIEQLSCSSSFKDWEY